MWCQGHQFCRRAPLQPATCAAAAASGLSGCCWCGGLSSCCSSEQPRTTTSAASNRPCAPSTCVPANERACGRVRPGHGSASRLRCSAAALHLLAPALQRWNGRAQPTRGEAGSAACGPGRRTCVAIGVGFSGSPRSGPWANGMKLSHCSPARAGSGRVLVFLAGVARVGAAIGRGLQSCGTWAGSARGSAGPRTLSRALASVATCTLSVGHWRGHVVVTRAGHGRARS